MIKATVQNKAAVDQDEDANAVLVIAERLADKYGNMVWIEKGNAKNKLTRLPTEREVILLKGLARPEQRGLLSDYLAAFRKLRPDVAQGLDKVV